jgi:hypothetical protein
MNDALIWFAIAILSNPTTGQTVVKTYDFPFHSKTQCVKMLLKEEVPKAIPEGFTRKMTCIKFKDYKNA